MRADMTFVGEEFDSAPIKAAGRIHFNGMAALYFTQGDSCITIIVPARMQSCLETIARVFNECMDAPIVSQTRNLTPDPTSRPDRGQYIGLTREPDPYAGVQVGGLTRHGEIRGADQSDGFRVFHSGGILIVTAEVAVEATKCGWELAPEHPTSGDLVAIKR